MHIKTKKITLLPPQKILAKKYKKTIQVFELNPRITHKWITNQPTSIIEDHDALRQLKQWCQLWRSDAEARLFIC